MLRSTLLVLDFTALASAHTAAWAQGMYCRNGTDPNVDNANNDMPIGPLYNHKKEDWWFQHHRGCDAAPPKAGEFLELPANGDFTVELAHNRAFTTLSYNGKSVSDWPDGKQHPEDWNGWGTDGVRAVCLKEDGALHTWNQSWAAGTAFAISYQSDIKDVTMENLVVFSTLYHTPWKRLATYQVPDLPACPEGGCTCAWLWIPNACGQANMYMQGFKCNVTNASPTAAPLAKAQAPVYCENEPDKCVKRAKQMLVWQQATGDNIKTEPGLTPNYNQKCGWKEGAQTDIFEKVVKHVASTSASPSTAASLSMSTSTLLVAPPASYSEFFSAAPYQTSTSMNAPPASYSEFFSAAPYQTMSTPVIAPPASYSEFVSAAPYSTPAGGSSAPTLVTLVSSMPSVLSTSTPVGSPNNTASAISSSKMPCTHAVSADATPSRIAYAAKPTKSCSRRRPWRRC